MHGSTHRGVYVWLLNHQAIMFPHSFELILTLKRYLVGLSAVEWRKLSVKGRSASLPKHSKSYQDSLRVCRRRSESNTSTNPTQKTWATTQQTFTPHPNRSIPPEHIIHIRSPSSHSKPISHPEIPTSKWILKVTTFSEFSRETLPRSPPINDSTRNHTSSEVKRNRREIAHNGSTLHNSSSASSIPSCHTRPVSSHHRQHQHEHPHHHTRSSS